MTTKKPALVKFNSKSGKKVTIHFPNLESISFTKPLNDGYVMEDQLCSCILWSENMYLDLKSLCLSVSFCKSRILTQNKYDRYPVHLHFVHNISESLI